MGLSTKEVSGDQEIENRGQTNLLQSEPPPTIRRLQQQPPEVLKCPRCSSTNTKFCYYNNYNKSQPRHFCKTCKRHWTKGGTLRNVPIGGGRKSKRPKLSNSPKTTTTAGSTTTTTAASLPMGANTTGNQKSMSDVLYQAMIRSSSTLLHDTKATTFTGLNNLSSPQSNPNTELIQFSTLSNTCNLIYPTSYQSFENHYIGNLDSLEESTVTTVNINPSSSSEPWDRSGALDLATDWNWNDIDVLSSADLNISWDDQDDAEIKP